MRELKKNKVLIQIGTNDAGDVFSETVKSSSPSKVILVEPNPELNNAIWDCYKDVPNVVLENVAITATPQERVRLVFPTSNEETGVAENGLPYGHVFFSLLPMKDWGKKLTELYAQGLTFNQLCDKYGITDVHFLQIDTEGYDSEIIRSIDFSKVNIDILKYEKWNFPEEAFEEYGDDAKRYGINGMKQTETLLRELGYEITEEGWDYIAYKL